MPVKKLCCSVFIVGLGFSASAQGQTSCSAVDQTTFCNGETLPAAATSRVSEEEPLVETLAGESRSTLNKAGETLLETRSSGGGSIASQAGTTTIVNDSEGQLTTINRADNTTFINRAEGNAVVCQQFGTVTLCN